MRKSLLLFAVIGLGGSLWAADPIIGTWKLNMEKSKYSPVFLALVKQSVVSRQNLYRAEICAPGIEEPQNHAGVELPESSY